jgi:hypothetical protein
MVIVNVPLRPLPTDRVVHLELALPRNGSLEAATRRATLFARLLDENSQHLTGRPPDYVPVRIRGLTATASLFGVGPAEAGAEAKQAAATAAGVR